MIILQDILKDLTVKTETRILMVIMDGLGGISHPETNKSELETAQIPNLDALARESLCGLTVPISYGITPGSGPSHLSLFGYDPLKYAIGRGVLEALGIGLTLSKTDLAVRANFATFDPVKKVILDRRAGRIPTEKNVELCTILQREIIQIDDVAVTIKPGKGHRFVVVFRGEDLDPNITENDPQKEGHPPVEIKPITPSAKRTVEIVNKFLSKIQNVIGTLTPANYALLRGYAKYPDIPSMREIYKLTPAAIATYPMYRGLAQLVGMDILPVNGETINDELATLTHFYTQYDFFYFHVKPTDALGEDGNFMGKVKKLEEIDAYVPQWRALNPDVLIVTGDHSTPSVLKGHSWHPVPFLLCSKYTSRNDVTRFTERECRNGSLGIFPAQNVMPLALANALKLIKYGA